MAVTHADLEIGRRSRELGSKAGTAVIVLSVLCGLLGFASCLLAESTRSKAAWVVVTEGGEQRYDCVYSGNGKTALFCGIGGFLSLAIALLIQHAYIWLALSNKSLRNGAQPLIWDVESSSSSAKLLLKQAALLFLAAWVCFGVAEVLLGIGMFVESSHLNTWQEPRDHCLVIRRWLFLAAGIFDVLTILLATSFYGLLLRIKRLRERELAIGVEVREADLFSSTTSQPPEASTLLHLRPNTVESDEIKTIYTVRT